MEKENLSLIFRSLSMKAVQDIVGQPRKVPFKLYYKPTGSSELKPVPVELYEILPGFERFIYERLRALLGEATQSFLVHEAYTTPKTPQPPQEDK